MLIRSIKGEFSGQYIVTVGVEFASKSVTIEGNKEVRLQIWDTVEVLLFEAGQETFRAIVRSFYKGIAGVFLSFALDKEETLANLREWQREARQYGHEEIVFFLVGTRADLDHDLNPKVIESYMKELEAAFFIETSALNGMNIEELFQKGAETMYKKYMCNESYRILVNPQIGLQNRQQSFVLAENKVSMLKKKKKCCN